MSDAHCLSDCGSDGAECCEWCGEPGGNRTHNPQIKSLLLCQLSYRPETENVLSTSLAARRPNHRFYHAQPFRACRLAVA